MKAKPLGIVDATVFSMAMRLPDKSSLLREGVVSDRNVCESLVSVLDGLVRD